jgi:7-cyano-7-deazaguanine synthase in queuosine biosynthesis
MSGYELVAPFEAKTEPSFETLSWPVPGKTTQIRTGLDWPLTVYGTVTKEARDLLHIAAAAYVADLRSPRPLGFSRTMDIMVHVHKPALWRGPAGQTLADLLAWVSGDEWTIRPVATAAGKTAKPSDQPLPDTQPRKDVMLLSGGLDSFCGAVDQLNTTTTRLHIGHRDSAKSVRHAQSLIARWLTETAPEFAWQRHELGITGRKRENSTRTRSLLFMAMAIAAAVGSGAKTVLVPENGFTSMNVPLIPSRGGSLSTKSTHPWTFHLVQQLLQHASIDVAVTNPHIALTKGELLAKAAKAAPAGFIEASGNTLSCAKLDAGRFRKADGGNPNINCGLCYACLVRRGAYQSAGIADPTDYLVNRLKGPALNALRKRRHDDLWALDLAEARGLTEDDLISSAAWPADTDLAATLDLVERGRTELFSVPR